MKNRAKKFPELKVDVAYDEKQKFPKKSKIFGQNLLTFVVDAKYGQ